MEPQKADSVFLNSLRKAETPVRIATSLPDPTSGGPMFILAKIFAFNDQYLVLSDPENEEFKSLLSRKFVGLISPDMGDD